MGLEDLAAIVKAAQEEARKQAEERRRLPDRESHTCSLAGGGSVTFDVPNTRK